MGKGFDIQFSGGDWEGEIRRMAQGHVDKLAREGHSAG
jgi:hypothetical protein